MSDDDRMTESPLTIREATVDDVAEIVRLLADDRLGSLREVLADPPPLPYLEAFDRIQASPNNTLLVAEAAGEVVGCLQLTVIPGLSRQGQTRGQIEGVRIAAGSRNRGWGERLVQAAIDRARAVGCTVVQLTTDKRRTDAHRFYRRLDFEATHEGMKKPLG